MRSTYPINREGWERRESWDGWGWGRRKKKREVGGGKETKKQDEKEKRRKEVKEGED